MYQDIRKKGEDMIAGFIRFSIAYLTSWFGLSYVQLHQWVHEFEWLIKAILSGFIAFGFFVAQFEYKRWRERKRKK